MRGLACVPWALVGARIEMWWKKWVSLALVIAYSRCLYQIGSFWFLASCSIMWSSTVDVAHPPYILDVVYFKTSPENVISQMIF